MNVGEIVLGALTAVSIPSLLGLLVHARSKNKKLNAEASKLGADEVKVISATAMQLLQPVRDELAKAQEKCKRLSEQVDELTAEVEHQRQVVLETTTKLEAANKRAEAAQRRADYYQNAFDSRADGGEVP